MRLMVDMNLSPAWVDALGAAGHDAVHWSSVGAVDAKDPELMAFALREDRVVFTHDLDFTAVLATTRATGPSVLQLREQDIDPERVADAVLRALAQFENELSAGAVVTLNLRRARARVLPLRR